ncbi:MAG TPA: LysR family transcriptional regulator [Kofleriaceae bacterium]|nr:LysR family transcriptional regulator [Kofleriaceae bacterium]
MELRDLGYFVAVFEERSVSAAARRCFISQPSVSAAIAGLETELGAKLFVRHRRGTTPTAAGEQLYPTARRLLGETQALRTAFRAPVRPRSLVVGLMASLDAHRIRDVLEVIAAAAGGEPAIQLRLVEAGERCDLRLVSRPMVHATERFAPLWSERFVVALPATHPLALRPTLRAADLVGERLVERCHCEYARRFARGRPQVQPVAIARSEEWALALVAAGIGLAIVPEGSARSDPRVAVRTLADVTVSREVGIAYRARSARASEIDSIVTQLRRRFGPARIARTA